METEALHRKKLHEEEILKIRRSNDDLHETLRNYEEMIVNKNGMIEEQNKVIYELKESLNLLDNFNSRWDEEEKLVQMMKKKLMNRDKEMKLW